MRQLLKITSIFALALVFTAGMAFGQPTGAGVQPAEVPNLNEFQDNVSVVNQFELTTVNNASSNATIDQVGVGNVSLLEQGSDPGTRPGPGHDATIQMTGNNNYSSVYQQANSAGHSDVTVKMQGDGNVLSQDGNKAFNNNNSNDAVMRGNVDFDLDVLGNQNTVEAPVTEQSDVTIKLQGDYNDILNRSQSQFFGTTGPRSESTIRVLGDENDVTVQQGVGTGFGGGGLPFPEDSFSSVDIEGSFNEVSVQQTDAPSAANTISNGGPKLDRSSILSSGFSSP